MLKADQNLVGRVLQASVRLVQLARRFRGELAELVTVFHMGKSAKNQIGAHKLWISLLGKFPSRELAL